MTPFARHVEKWKNCQACSYCENRKNVVLLRGSVPCDVLFIGEAPGPAENSLGQPFKGPAGHLLDDIIRSAISSLPDDEQDVSWAFTNLVACIPKGGDGKKFLEPNEESIKACEERLNECVRLCRPRSIVLVGQLAQKWIKGEGQFYINPDYDRSVKYEGWLQDGQYVRFTEIIHPAAILRADESQKPLAIKRCTLSIVEAMREPREIPF